MKSIRKRKQNSHELEIEKGKRIVEKMKIAVEIAKASAELACCVSQSRFPSIKGVKGGTHSSEAVGETTKEPKVFNIAGNINSAIIDEIKKYKWGGKND